MSEPSLALQGAILSTLYADTTIAALVAKRIYDRVPSSPTFPYLELGDDVVNAAHAECLEGSTEVFATVHAWSRGQGKVEAKQLAGAVVKALNGAALTTSGYRLVLIEHDSTRHLTDPDGLTSHSVITFHVLIDEE
jgi:hypothetical protein